MSDVIFYDFDLNIMGIFARYISLNMTRKYSGYGTLELHFPRSEARLIELLSRSDYMIVDCEHGQAIVTGWRIDDDIAVFGKTPEWLMTKRAIANFKAESRTGESAAYLAVESGMGDFVTVCAEKGIGTAKNFENEGAKTVYDIVRDALEKDKLGFRLYIDFDEKTFNFEVYCGEERDALFSESARTAHDAVYTREIEKKVSGGVWYERKSVGANGMEVREWVQTDAGEEVGAKRWNAVLSALMTDCEAEAEAKRYRAEECIECGVRRLELGKDYDLGDIIRLQFEYEAFKRAMKRRVCAVEIHSDSDGFGITPILEDD